jgi:hypothetical protein
LASDSNFQLLITPKTIAVASFVIGILGLIEGALPQTEMIATGGHVPISSAVLKFLLAGLLFIAVAWQPGNVRVTRFGLAWVACVLYFLTDSLYLMAHFHLSFFDLAVAYNSYYAYFLLCPLALFVENEFTERRALQILFITFGICFALGMTQFLLQKPILYTDSADGSFSVQSWITAGELRVFSLFGSALAYGIFCCLIGSLSLAFALGTRAKILAGSVFVASAIGCYTTLTRNCYLQFGFCIICVFLLTRKRLLGLVKYIPILFLIGALLVAWRGASGATTDSNVTSNSSLLLRIAEWVYYLTIYSNASLTEKMLGLGIIQSPKASNDALFVVDNEYLAVLVHVGIIGFVLIFTVQWMIWVRVYRRAIQAPSVFTIGTAAFASTLFAAYFYNIALVPYAIAFMMVTLIRPDRNKWIVRSSLANRLLSAAK